MTITKFAFAVATVAATIGLAACSTSTTGNGPSTITVTAPATTAASTPSTTATSAPPPTSSSAPVVDQDSGCEVNPSSAPVPTAEPYGMVPDVGRISVALNGIPSHSITAGSAPTEVEITVCNDSAVSYPEVGLVSSGGCNECGRV